MTHDPTGQRERRPIFDMDSQIAHQAGNLLAYLSKEPAHKFMGDGGTWDEEDRFALDVWTELEQDIYLCDTNRDSDDRMEPVKQFRELCFSFHTALPYSEAEREWLLQHTRDVIGRGNEFELIDELEGQIVSAGLRQTVRGRDLMQRWIAWHRETDEYAGQHTIGVARSALAGLIGLLEPKQPLPEPYLALMRERDSTS